MSLPDLSTPPVRAKGMVHRQIAVTAKALCEEHWEALARDNAFYARFKKPGPFVRKHWQKYVPMARQIMTGMLGNPKYDDAFKRKLYEVLTLDGTINPKQMAVPAAKPTFRLTKE